jgi:hypothetical protein
MSRLAEKVKALGQAIAGIEKQFGKGSVMRLGDGIEPAPVAVVPTGSLGLDLALGVGGLPRGRVVEIYGPESSGKTTLALHAIAEVQRQGGVAAFVDAEHALDVTYARRLGVNLAELLVSQPDTGEQALEIVDALVRSGSVDLIVIETFSDLYEIREAIKAARQVCDLPVVASVTFTRDDRTLLGDDPIRAGIVTRLNHPEGNVTGITLYAFELEMKKLEVLAELAPRVSIIAVLRNPNAPEAEPQACTAPQEEHAPDGSVGRSTKNAARSTGSARTATPGTL